jgi:hypothetical protein
MAEWEEAVLFCSVFLSLPLGGRRVYGQMGFQVSSCASLDQGLRV